MCVPISFLIEEFMVHGMGVKLVFHEPGKNFDYVGCCYRVCSVFYHEKRDLASILKISSWGKT